MYGKVTTIAGGETYIIPDGSIAADGIAIVTIRTQEFHDAGATPIPGLRVKYAKADRGHTLTGIQCECWLDVKTRETACDGSHI